MNPPPHTTALQNQKLSQRFGQAQLRQCGKPSETANDTNNIATLRTSYPPLACMPSPTSFSFGAAAGHTHVRFSDFRPVRPCRLSASAFAPSSLILFTLRRGW
jgi:hypothetical protein